MQRCTARAFSLNSWTERGCELRRRLAGEFCRVAGTDGAAHRGNVVIRSEAAFRPTRAVCVPA